MNQAQAGGVVGNPNSRRELGIAFVIEDVSSGQARGEERRSNDFIPIETHAGLDEQTIGDEPAILGVGTGFVVVNRGVVAAGENRIARTSWRGHDGKSVRIGGTGLGRLPRRRLDLQKRDRLAQELRVVDQTVEVGAQLDIVAAIPLTRRKVEIRQGLQTAGGRVFVQIVVAAARQDGLDVAGISMRSEGQVVLVSADSGFEQRAAAEIVLIFERPEVGGFDLAGSGLGRHQSPHSGVGIVEVIRQEAGRHDVAGGEVGLQLDQVVDAPDVVKVGTVGELLGDVVVVLAVEGIEKPRVSLADGAGHGVDGRPVGERDAFDILRSGNEVGCEEAEVVVAHAGVQGHYAARTFAKLGRLAAWGDCVGAEGIDAGLHYERPASWLRYVETVEHQKRLVSLGAGYVCLTVGVGCDSGHEDQGIAIVVRTGVGNVEKFLAAEFFLGGNLRGVDGRWGFDYIYHFTRLTLAGKSHVYIGGKTNLYVGLNGGIETGFFDAQFRGSGG